MCRDSLEGAGKIRGRIAGALRKGITPASARRQLHGFLIGVCFDWLQDPEQYSLSDDSEGVVETLMRGLFTSQAA